VEIQVKAFGVGILVMMIMMMIGRTYMGPQMESRGPRE